MTLKRMIGREKLKRKLRKIPKEMKRESLKALKKEGDQLMAFQKSLAPEEDGDLKRSFRKTVDSNLISVTVEVGGGKAFYARFQEFGTPNDPAQPFFFPSYRSSKRGAKASVRKAVRKAVKHVARS